ncbi:MAG: TonB-dependent receptor, partial [Bacteroidota bacterium]
SEGEPIINTGEFLAGFGAQLFNREEVSRIEVAQPRNKVIFSAIYNFKRIKINLTNTRFGEIDYVHPSTAEVANTWNGGALEIRDQTFSPKILTDLDITVKLSDMVDLGIGGTNIFNVYPDRHTHSGNYSGGMFPYSRRVTQFGLAGAGYYAKANFNF